MSVTARTKASRQLGEALLAESAISANQLQHALQVQQDSLVKRRLGDILVDLGYLTKRRLREVARKYQHRPQIGELLVESGKITQADLEEALRIQRTTKQPLGAILVERKLITEEDLAQSLSRQTDYAYIVPNRRLVDRALVGRFSAVLLKEQQILPLFEEGGVVTFLVHNPLDRTLLQILNGYLKGDFDFAVGPKSAIERVLNEVLEEQTLLTQPPREEGEEAGGDTTFSRYDLDRERRRGGAEGQVVGIVDYLLASAIKERASDIHIDSLYNRVRVRHRVDGKLVFSTDLPHHLGEQMLRRIKVLAKIDIAEHIPAADGHIYVKLEGKDIDLRVALYETVLGPSVTVRVLTKEIGLRDLEDLGMLPRGLATLRQMLDTAAGMILFAGPTGAGKTTSLYACLNYLNKNDLKICTLESPVEYSIEGVAQAQIRSPSAEELSNLVKSMMHQDPDVIVLGEITNEASAAAATQAALSGHKVFSTIHTEDTFGAVFRLMDLGLRTYLLSSTGVAVMSQRLLRKVCPECRRPFTPPRDLIRQFNLKDLDLDAWEFFQGKGCERCNRTGFHDRSGVFEILAVNDEIRNAFLENQHTSAIRKIAHTGRRFLSLRQAGFIKALNGETTLDEALGMLSYSERQASASLSLSGDDIKYWMEDGGAAS